MTHRHKCTPNYHKRRGGLRGSAELRRLMKYLHWFNTRFHSMPWSVKAAYVGLTRTTAPARST